MDAVSSAIIEYLALTDSYGRVGPLLATGQYGVEMHFHKKDPDRPGSHSCRQIVTMRNDAWQASVDQWMAGMCQQL